MLNASLGKKSSDVASVSWTQVRRTSLRKRVETLAGRAFASACLLHPTHGVDGSNIEGKDFCQPKYLEITRQECGSRWDSGPPVLHCYPTGIKKFQAPGTAASIVVFFCRI